MKTNLNQDFDICEFKAIDNKLEVTCKYKNGERITFILSEASKIEFKNNTKKIVNLKIYYLFIL